MRAKPHMHKIQRPPVSARSTSPSKREPRGPPASTSTTSLEASFRDALDEELARPLASLVARLAEVARRLAPRPAQGTSRPRPVSDARPPQPAPAPRQPPLPAPEPTDKACAVIGCKRPHRSQGYCAAHYQKRRLMAATGRLHAAWVENAAPHTLPDVILPRGRKPKADAAPPAPKPPVSATPRMWVRKKGADGASGPGAPTPAGKPEASRLATDRERATATAQRWASEFRSPTRRG
ncbi:vegetative family protein [Stigmatella aurantiaca DW4/3-1]|uniref:Vegetative family protein n=1 Tax=Stigmatella aurantiaca (strain DW4/3-1) TaxID=378806 RepID=E3FJ92_STIAD|nr:vegetative family protein [Stigmatella aurantiaca DW4/3-1]